MYSLLLKTQLQPGSLEQFMDAMSVNAASSVRDEPGCLVFDVVRDRSAPDLVWLYEVYTDEAAFEAHLLTPHFLASRPLVDPLIVRQEVIEGDVLAFNATRG
ncbi:MULTISPECIES: putative quinol monooxygenase [unclassified Pseudomonas]|uniref:putative quinol monooxygenase n=1 Tax=unclassified Pseudomonas TaxID=196821 RepID=UPI00158F3640|nr:MULTISPECIES: putative quinol monooxygenase [unclassified Pseudomonas]MCU1723233.1 antibiotic biosynthesis monooxygenase [Pseudomonas sp. 5P_5.1_Bac1]MCU1731646.1 antibiotic biosynthesis monooxygenase [Pseudomonas sp. 20P_3.2_Bac4]MCU1745733.1 antibiotic biosynthesis monooxygenase [Pseudomonas sp. 20P_3.2_Bac5]